MMESRLRKTFTKKERLCGKSAISRLLAKGSSGYAGCIRFTCMPDNGDICDRILVSVPKKLFRRAVKRNLLKRRIRESFRLQKHCLGDAAFSDIMFVYNSKEVKSFNEVYQSIGKALEAMKVSGRKSGSPKCEETGQDPDAPSAGQDIRPQYGI